MFYLKKRLHKFYTIKSLVEKQKLILFTDDVLMTKMRDANVQTGDTNEKKNETDYAGDLICYKPYDWLEQGTFSLAEICLIKVETY